VPAQLDLQHLQLSATILNKSIEGAEHYYDKSVRNLKKAAPNLRVVEVFGGYVMNPEGMVTRFVVF
jgi:hypothetical protein